MEDLNKTREFEHIEPIAEEPENEIPEENISQTIVIPRVEDIVSDEPEEGILEEVIEETPEAEDVISEEVLEVEEAVIEDTVGEEPSEDSDVTEEDALLNAKIHKRKKKRNRKKKAKKIMGPLIAIVFVLAISLFVFARSDYFTVDKVRVLGNDYYTNSQVREICGAEKGVNIFSIHKRSMLKLLKSDPYILDAEISRELPSTLVIRVIESEERGAVYCEKNYYVIDSSGYILKVTTKKPKNMPKITGLTVTKGNEGENIEVKEVKMYDKVLSMINTSAKSTITYKKIKVRKETCSAYVKEKLYIKGTPEDIEGCIKSGKMEAVLYDIYEKGIKKGRISVGSDNYCVFRP